MENKQNIKDLIQKFYPHAKEKLGFEHPVRVIMRQDAENAKDSLGKTAYYDPAEKLIVLYVTNRHPKDVLRSFSHELVHHAQNCRGDLDDLSTDGHYAGDGKGREIEAEAYLLGNGFLVRDWEDSIKFKGVNEMKLTKKELFNIVEQLVNEMEKPEEDEVPGGEPGKGSSLEEQEQGTAKPAEPVQGTAEPAEPVDISKLPPELRRMFEEWGELIAKADIEFEEFQAAVEAMSQKMQLKNPKVPDYMASDKEIDEISPVPTPIPKRDKDDELEEEYDPKKADLDKDGKVSDYEEKRGKAAFGESKQSNKSWYNSNLYESLKSKWTK